MPLFQESIIKKYLATLDQDAIETAYNVFRQVYSASKIQNIKTAKEEQYQEGFIKDIFGTVLGYAVYPDHPYNIETEKKNETNSKKADGAILKDEKVFGVIELKDNKTKNLDAVKDQAFAYKNNHKECKYVISSNFHKLRFYIDDATDYEEFDLYSLDKETFKRFYLYLRKEGLLDKNLPKLLREETKFHEEEISKKLYKDYSQFKRSFFENAVNNNPQYDKLLLFKKSQKFLDRILFLLFAEDKGLVGTNSIVKIVEKWSAADDDYYRPLYELINVYFGHLYKGYTYQRSGEEIPEFGGELFAPDDVLDNLKIDDAVLKNDLLVLSKYDFNTDVDVNILGHIFEHSLNEVDDVEAELRGEVLDKTKSKRKKDGVFYTPKYITKYIVDNTLGKICAEKKAELKLDEDISIFEYKKADGKLNDKGKDLFERLNAYKAWLLTLKVCDPACGSGAFLNQALSFFIEEHQFADDIIAELTDTPLRLFDTDLQILENNIYGVDINDESVEIAKLSLWLRTARPGRKLSNLSNNIKCGNSLIDDPTVAGDKAFNWQKEFRQVFENGGFDVVFGNPPYVVYIKSVVGEKTLNYVNNKYSFAEYNPNTYSLFTDLALNKIVNKNGYVGLIIPNTWLEGQYFSKMRNGVYSKNVDEILYLKGSVFAEIVETVVLISRNIQTTKKEIKLSKNLLENEYEIVDFDVIKYKSGFNPFVKKNNNLLYKLESNFSILGQHAIIYRGLETKDNSKWLSETKINDNYLPILLGRDVNRYHYEHSGTFVNFIKDQMKSNANEQMYLQPKILMRRTGSTIIATIEKENLFALKNLYLIIPKKPNEIYSIIAQLNSRLMHFFHVSKTSGENKAFAQFQGNYIANFPYISSSDQRFKVLVENIILLTIQLEGHIKKLNNYLQIVFPNIQQSKKLQSWLTNEFSIFINELNIGIVKAGGNRLTRKEEIEWMELFEENKKKALDLKSQIDQTDKEIDRMVYELYGLMEEEISIIENS